MDTNIDFLAFSLNPNWANGLQGILPNSAGGGVAGLSQYIATNILAALEIGFIALAVVMLFVYAASFVFAGHDENAVTESRLAYVHAITGAALVGLAHLLVQAFSPTETGSNIVNVAPLKTGFGNVVFYFRILLAIALTFNIVYQGFRLIMSQTQEDGEKARKRLLYGFIGVAIVLLAQAIVRAFDVEGVLGGTGSPTGIAVEIVGIANFLLTLIGAMAVFALIIAGVLLLVSVDESLKDKAKTIVKTTVITLAVVLVSFALVNTVIALA
jgi:hypothetical protein